MLFEVLGRRPYTTNWALRASRWEQRQERGWWRLEGRQRFIGEGKPATPPVRVVATPLHRTLGSPQDVGACAPAVKAFLDGLVWGGLLPDDGPEFVAELVFLPPVRGYRDDGLRVEVRPI